jgi:hypothetical protein
VAHEHDLPYFHDQVHFPDLRIEYEEPVRLTVCSTVISEALATEAGRLECLVLPHRYDHLSPIADIIESRSRGDEKGARGSGTD